MQPHFAIAVYCSASESLPAAWTEAAERLGLWIARTDSTLVYGGVDAGLMRVVAQAAKSMSTARTIGVVPSLRAGMASPLNDTVLPARGLHDRKETMISLADVFVALPGGYGTLDEIISTFAHLRFNGDHSKPLLVLNLDNIFDPLTEQLRLMVDKGLMTPDALSAITFVSSADQLTDLLDRIRNEKI